MFLVFRISALGASGFRVSGFRDIGGASVKELLMKPAWCKAVLFILVAQEPYYNKGCH